MVISKHPGPPEGDLPRRSTQAASEGTPASDGTYRGQEVAAPRPAYGSRTSGKVVKCSEVGNGLATLVALQ